MRLRNKPESTDEDKDFFVPVLLKGGIVKFHDGTAGTFFQMRGAQGGKVTLSPPVVFHTAEEHVKFLTELIKLAAQTYGVSIPLVPPEADRREETGPYI